MTKKLMVALVGLMMLCGAALVQAQTPDGDTPADETVCDVLRDDGITKGLYGLCVAFCEAQDHASEYVEISEDALEALLAATPSGRILENYNKKKDKANNPIDPDMPCVRVEEPCPCWTSEEFNVALLYPTEACHRWNGTNHNGSQIQNYDQQHPIDLQYILLQAIDHQHGIPGGYGRSAHCTYYDYHYDYQTGLYEPGSILRTLPITPDELTACDAQIRAYQDELGWACGSGS